MGTRFKAFQAGVALVIATILDRTGMARALWPYPLAAQQETGSRSKRHLESVEELGVQREEEQ